MNQRLLEQNQQLTHELKAVTQKVNAPDPPGVQRRIIPVVQPPAGGANVLTTEPTTGSAVGGGELMAPPSGPTPHGPGLGANVLFTQPMSGSAFGGGELMAAPSRPDPPASAASAPTSSGVSRARRPPSAAAISSPSTKGTPAASRRPGGSGGGSSTTASGSLRRTRIFSSTPAGKSNGILRGSMRAIPFSSAPEGSASSATAPTPAASAPGSKGRCSRIHCTSSNLISPSRFSSRLA